jgi:hypothetical protein
VTATTRGVQPDGAAGDDHARVRWTSAPALRLHAALLAGLTLAGAATWLEWTRAHAGHTVAWVYTFEWPLFAVLGICLWWRLLHPVDTAAGGDQADPAAAGTTPDPDLVAWQAYLARLHEVDPPGGPPARG